MSRDGTITRSRESCEYTSCYCEENVWKLCDSVQTDQTAPLDHLSVIFISNDSRMVPLWRQRSGRGDRPVVWDYHVILLHRPPQSDAQVYDLDSELSFPCSLHLYASQALRSDHNINPAYHRRLRVVPADCFLRTFASDRSHMKNPDGSWKMPPPPYPPIQTTDCHMNLDDFISMTPGVGWGSVHSLEDFLQTYVGDTPPFPSSS